MARTLLIFLLDLLITWHGETKKMQVIAQVEFSCPEGNLQYVILINDTIFVPIMYLCIMNCHQIDLLKTLDF